MIFFIRLIGRADHFEANGSQRETSCRESNSGPYECVANAIPNDNRLIFEYDYIGSVMS